MVEFRNKLFIIFSQEKGPHEPISAEIRVPSNLQEVKERDELCYNF